MSRFLGYGLLGFMITAIGYFIGLNLIEIFIALIIAFTISHIIGWVW